MGLNGVKPDRKRPFVLSAAGLPEARKLCLIRGQATRERVNMKNFNHDPGGIGSYFLCQSQADNSFASRRESIIAFG